MRTRCLENGSLPSYDFVILSTQRSGTHMLATALNSHPDIGCEGEIGYPDHSIGEVSGRLRGCIVMFNRIKWMDVLKPGKVLLLLRNPENTARSRAANSLDRKQNPEHRGMAFRGESLPIHPTPDPGIVARTARAIRRQHAELISTYGLSSLVLRYEDLTADQDIEQIPDEQARRIADYLRVGFCPLRTRTRKIAQTA